jgi:hypothetical protein
MKLIKIGPEMKLALPSAVRAAQSRRRPLTFLPSLEVSALTERPRAQERAARRFAGRFGANR